MSVFVAGPGVPSVVELGTRACEDVGASTYHIWSEGELLAVEDEQVAFLIDVLLVPAALSLQSFDLTELVGDFVDVFVAVTYALLDFAFDVFTIGVVL